MEDHEFGGSAEVFVLEDSFINLAKCSGCRSDWVVNVFLSVAVRWQNSSDVCEVVILLEVGFTTGDVQVCDEAKTTLSVAEDFNRLLRRGSSVE